MDIESSLKSIGLNYREIQVYLATLELGQSTVLPISKKSGFKRTYCYDILEELKKKKLVDYIEKNGRRRYFAEDPKKIEDELKNNLSGFQELLPELRSIYNQPAAKPKVRYFEGREGIISVYEEVVKAKEAVAIGSPKHLYQFLGDYFPQFVERTVGRGLKIRELISADGVEAAEYIRKNNYKKPAQEARLLPSDIRISTDMMIFGDKMALISYGEELHAVVIESSSLIDTQKALFEIIWASAKEIK